MTTVVSKKKENGNTSHELVLKKKTEHPKHHHLSDILHIHPQALAHDAVEAVEHTFLRTAIAVENVRKKFTSRLLMEQHPFFSNSPPPKWAELRSPANYVKKVLAMADVDPMLHKGIPIQKITSNGKFKSRVLTISQDRFAIFITHGNISNTKTGLVSTAAKTLPVPWISRKGGITLFRSKEGVRDAFVRYIDVADIDSIEHGFPSTYRMELSRTKPRLKGLNSRVDNQKELLVSIRYRADETLDIVMQNERQQRVLVQALNSMRRSYHEAKYFVVDEARLLRYIWYDVDYNQDGLVAEKEFLHILNRINLHVRNAPQVYQRFVRNHTDGEVTYHHCMDLLFQIQKEDHEVPADVLWNKLFGSAKIYVTAEEFLHLFIHNCQKETDATVDDVLLLFDRVNKMEINQADHSTPPNCLSHERFGNYLCHIFNAAFDPMLGMFCPEDMNRPLSEYWINTSHNTYLTGDQLRSASSVEMYAAALRRGCKCLELDCWDGDISATKFKKPIPVVLHGGTLTSKILFEDIIQCVKCYMEAHPETYPIILSLENHCSLPYQQEMARILKEKLGSKLYAPFDVSHEYDKALRGNVMMNGGVVEMSTLTLHENDDLPSPAQLQGRVIIKGKIPREDDEPEETESENPAHSNHRASAHFALSLHKKKPTKHAKIVRELASLTLLAGAKWKDFDESIQLASNQMHSIGETKIAKASKDPKKWREYNKRHMTRTYPAGTRVDSSNYNPVLAWSMGCQLVALNFQTSDTPLLLNDGRFRQNGGCGYVLKPPSVMNKSKFHLVSPWTLKIRILGGSCLPKPGGSKQGEKIDPYVTVTVHDIVLKNKKEVHKTSSHTTTVVNDNGFCPCWSEDRMQEFEVWSPEVAIVQFSLMEKDIGSVDDKVADSAVPMSCMRHGYRSIQLYDKHGGRSGHYNFATLLVEVQLEGVEETVKLETPKIKKKRLSKAVLDNMTGATDLMSPFSPTTPFSPGKTTKKKKKKDKEKKKKRRKSKEEKYQEGGGVEEQKTPVEDYA